MAGRVLFVMVGCVRVGLNVAVLFLFSASFGVSLRIVSLCFSYRRVICGRFVIFFVRYGASAESMFFSSLPFAVCLAGNFSNPIVRGGVAIVPVILYWCRFFACDLRGPLVGGVVIYFRQSVFCVRRVLGDRFLFKGEVVNCVCYSRIIYHLVRSFAAYHCWRGE